jgi:carboxypeptidase Q
VPDRARFAQPRDPQRFSFLTLLAFLFVTASRCAFAECEVQLTPAQQECAQRLLHAALSSDESWKKLSYLCDFIGARLSGSENLEKAVKWAEQSMIEDGLENVRLQPVQVPHWVRGKESAVLVHPRNLELNMMGLGRSIGTPRGGITAEVLPVQSFDELTALPDDVVRGKIVLWNVPFTSYSETVKYRSTGGMEASRKGAIASLVRTVGKRTLDNPHTGAQSEQEKDVAPIPAAALSIEDAQLIARLAAAGAKPAVHLTMEAHMLPDALSYNVVGEVRGRELPDEIVVVGGHLDSWDVGQGAHDDGGGCIVAMEAVRLLKQTGIRPRRTVRAVLWTNEENGTRGAKEYHRIARERREAHVAAIESDGGVENPIGFGVSVRKAGPVEEDKDNDVDPGRQARALAILREFALWIAPVEADSISEGGGGADIDPLMDDGVPGLALQTPMELYWDIHHSHADTLDKIDPAALRRNVAAMAVMAYLLAEVPEKL